ncbi:diguanylate cyclase domain-containing protein [Kineococcus sp. TBRC 1896]|uniref:Diguanylate cyclase domain-containing protein n=1 Tax=Kineococcus mangrovi TaxID=1660183 RepID=A0ABV4IB99_9ACTN
MRTWSNRGRDALSGTGRLGADLGVLAGVLLALALVQSLLGRGSTPALLLLGSGEAAAAFLAAGLLTRAVRRRAPSPWQRRSWALLALACWSWGTGQLVYVVEDVLGLAGGATTWADGPFLLFSFSLVASGLSWLRGQTRAHLGVGALLDGVLLGTSLLMVVWVGWLAEAVHASPLRLTDLVVPLTYPLLDLVFLTMVLVQVTLSGPTRTGVFCLAAVSALAFADAAYLCGVLAPGGFRTGGPPDFAWIAAFGVVAVNARHHPAAPVQSSPATEGSTGWVVSYLVMFPACLCGVVRLWTVTDHVVLVLLVTMAATVMTRQFLALDDHRRLLSTAERQRRQLDVLAHVDPLTGLENRRRFSDRTAEAVRDALGTGDAVVVAFVDLDRFKAVNDTLGHAAGDDLLRGVAARLRSSVREEDCAARWGGDEFAVLVTDPQARADDVVERLRAALTEPFRIQGTVVQASASIGAVREDVRALAAGRADDGDLVPGVVEALLAAADARMYVVKRAHRDPVALER